MCLCGRCKKFFDLVLKAKVDEKTLENIFDVIFRNSNRKMKILINVDKGTILLARSPLSSNVEKSCVDKDGLRGLSHEEKCRQLKNKYMEKRQLTVLWKRRPGLVTQNEVAALAEGKIRRKLLEKDLHLREVNSDMFVQILNSIVESKDNKNGPCEQFTEHTTNSNTVRAVSRRKVQVLEPLEETIAAPHDRDCFENPKYPEQETMCDSGSLSLFTTQNPHRYSFDVRNPQDSVRNPPSSQARPNVTLPPAKHQDYSTYEKRLESFSKPSWKSKEKPKKTQFADQGFFYTGRLDLVRCFQCGIGFKDWVKDDEIAREHIKYSSVCTYLRQKLGDKEVDSRKREIEAQKGATGSAAPPLSSASSSSTKSSGDAKLPYPVRSPQYQTMKSRLETFKTYPKQVGIPPEQLAVAGLYFTGTGDLVRCFACDGGLKDWSPGDDPTKEHATYFPKCGYINQLKGREYVEALQKSKNKETISTDQAASRSSNGTQESSTDIMTTALVSLGYTELDVIAAREELRRKGNSTPDVEAIVNTILDMQERVQSSSGASIDTDLLDDTPELSSMIEENMRLKEWFTCMLCNLSEPDILFLPCTHHRLCQKCASTVTRCPICNQTIKDRIKTYRS